MLVLKTHVTPIPFNHFDQLTEESYMELVSLKSPYAWYLISTIISSLVNDLCSLFCDIRQSIDKFPYPRDNHLLYIRFFRHKNDSWNQVLSFIHWTTDRKTGKCTWEEGALFPRPPASFAPVHTCRELDRRPGCIVCTNVLNINKSIHLMLFCGVPRQQKY